MKLPHIFVTQFCKQIDPQAGLPHEKVVTGEYQHHVYPKDHVVEWNIIYNLDKYDNS